MPIQQLSPLQLGLKQYLWRINLHVTGREQNRFEIVSINCLPVFRNEIISGIVVVVSTQSFGVVSVISMNTKTERQKAIPRREYPAVCYRGHGSSRWHPYLHIHNGRPISDMHNNNKATGGISSGAALSELLWVYALFASPLPDRLWENMTSFRNGKKVHNVHY